MLVFILWFTTAMTMTTQDYASCTDYGLHGQPHQSCSVEQETKMAKNLVEKDAKDGYKTMFIVNN